MLPSISVVVPIYNAELFLEKCLASLASQTYQNYNVILVNDGSKDNSKTICEKYISSNPNWILINQKNSGSQKARLNGVISATGDYITFLDSDDYIEPNYYYEVAKRLVVNYPDLFCVAATYETNANNQRKESNKIQSGIYIDNTLKDVLKRAIHFGEKYYDFGILPSNWSKFFKNEIAKNIYPRVNPFLKMGEDAVCAFSCLSICDNVEICNEITGYHYVYNGNSIVHSYDSLYFERFITLKENLYTLIRETKNEQFLISQLPYYYTFLIDIGISSLHLSKNPLKVISNMKKIGNIINICKMKNLIDFNIDSLVDIPERCIKRLMLIKKGKFLHLFINCIR